MDYVALLFMAIAALLSYKMPVFIARFVGMEPQLNSLWYTAANDDKVTFVLFLAAYMTVGFITWGVPAFFVIRACRRDNLVALGRGLARPIRPIGLRIGERMQAWEDQFVERRTLRALYKSEFAQDFPSFNRFMAYYDLINQKGYIAPGAPFTAAADPFHDAVILLGLEDGFKAEDLSSRYRSLMMAVHPDKVGPNDVARRITDARNVIKTRKGWR